MKEKRSFYLSFALGLALLGLSASHAGAEYGLKDADLSANLPANLSIEGHADLALADFAFKNGDSAEKSAYYLLDEDGKTPLGVAIAGRMQDPVSLKKPGILKAYWKAGLEFSRRLKPDWTLFTGLYYAFIGGQPDPSADEGARALAPSGRVATLAEAASGSGLNHESAPLLGENAELTEFKEKNEGKNNGLGFSVGKGMRLYAGATIEMTESSPDYGVTAGLRYKY